MTMSGAQAAEKKTWTATAVKGCLYFLLALSLSTGLLVFFGGGRTLPDVGSVPATVDGELRFYGSYWMAYGLFCAWVARDLKQRLSWVPAIAAVLFVSGVGRFLSLVLVGQPAPMFIPIMIFELVFSPLMLALNRSLKRNWGA